MSVPPRAEVLEPHLEIVLRPLEAIAFWSAIALPFLHIPLLFYGLETSGQLLAFFGLLSLNIAAFIIGHGHKRT